MADAGIRLNSIKLTEGGVHQDKGNCEPSIELPHMPGSSGMWNSFSSSVSVTLEAGDLLGVTILLDILSPAQRVDQPESRDIGSIAAGAAEPAALFCTRSYKIQT